MPFHGFQTALVLETQKAGGFHKAQLVDQGVGGLADQLFFGQHGFGRRGSSCTAGCSDEGSASIANDVVHTQSYPSTAVFVTGHLEKPDMKPAKWAKQGA